MRLYDRSATADPKLIYLTEKRRDLSCTLYTDTRLRVRKKTKYEIPPPTQKKKKHVQRKTV